MEAHQLIGAHFKRKIRDLKQLFRRCTARKDTHERGMRHLTIRRSQPLRFQKDRMSGPCCDVSQLVVEKSTESRGSVRYGKGRLLVLKNVRRKAILPSSDLLAKSLAQERWSHRPAVEQDGINARAIL